MGNRQLRGLQPIDHPERIAIEIDRQDHRFAGMPNDRQALADPARGEDLGEKIMQSLPSGDCLRVPIRKITITAIDVAERGGLDDQQLYSRHEAARLVIPGGPITNYATNYSKGSSCANCSSWASPSPGDANPRCATSYPRRGGARRPPIALPRSSL